MDLSKHHDHATSSLMRQSNSLVLNKTWMNHVCTKSVKIKQCFSAVC